MYVCLHKVHTAPEAIAFRSHHTSTDVSMEISRKRREMTSSSAGALVQCEALRLSLSGIVVDIQRLKEYLPSQKEAKHLILTLPTHHPRELL